MLLHLAFLGIVLAAPEPTVSYEKKVMVDPGYRSHMSPQEIEKALRPPPPRPRVVREIVVERVHHGRRYHRRDRWADVAIAALWTLPWIHYWHHH